MQNNTGGNPLWVPGKSPYGDWLKTLTPEQKEAHLAQRRSKKAMKKAWEQIVLSQQEAWLAKINEAMVAVINKAIQTGDASALIAVSDRILGRPTETIVSESDQILPWNEDDLKSTTENNQQQ